MSNYDHLVTGQHRLSAPISAAPSVPLPLKRAIAKWLVSTDSPTHDIGGELEAILDGSPWENPGDEFAAAMVAEFEGQLAELEAARTSAAAKKPEPLPESARVRGKLCVQTTASMSQRDRDVINRVNDLPNNEQIYSAHMAALAATDATPAECMEHAAACKPCNLWGQSINEAFAGRR